MKKYILAITIGLLLAGTVSAAYVVREKGEWDDWWFVGYGNDIRRIYDHENKLVCWLLDGGNGAVAMDCEPSLELEHPSTL